jgi:hypothetical protein
MICIKSKSEFQIFTQKFVALSLVRLPITEIIPVTVVKAKIANNTTRIKIV